MARTKENWVLSDVSVLSGKIFVSRVAIALIAHYMSSFPKVNRLQTLAVGGHLHQLSSGRYLAAVASGRRQAAGVKRQGPAASVQRQVPGGEIQLRQFTGKGLPRLPSSNEMHRRL